MIRKWFVNERKWLHNVLEIIESSTQFALTESEEQEEEEPTEQETTHPPKQFVSSSNSDEVEIFGPPLRPPIVPHKEPPRIIGASPSPIEIDEETCVLPPEAGPCVDYVPRWFYNSQTGNCEQFSYGSCGGNTNNFMDRQTCEAKCQSGKMCLFVFDVKHCLQTDELENEIWTRLYGTSI